MREEKNMQRRELLRGGALVGAGALADTTSTGCASQLPSLPPAPLPAPEDMDVYCADLESKLASISESEFVDGFVTQFAKNQPLSAPRRARVEAHEALFRRSLSSLFLSQTFRDLPAGAQRHPRLQALMQEHLPEVEQTVFDVTDMLETLGAEQREALRGELTRRSDLPMRISEAIDERAAAAGVSVNRRRQLRSMLTQASFRLRHAAPDTLIDEYTTKVRRATAPGGAAQALALQAAARATEDLFFAGPRASPWPTSSSVPGAGASLAAAPATAARRQRSGIGAGQPLPSPRAASSPSGSRARPGHPGSGTMTTGAWLLGIGAVTFGASVAIVSAGGTALLVGATIGALLFAIGLVVLLVGAIIYAAD
jgi:hypothetical protein